jgi:FKBP-type peptidyl-prolyl cis-trans isomerase 2
MSKVESGNTVRVHYTGTFENGEIFDSSVGNEPISFTVGTKQVIPGFENALMGMEVGENKTITLSPEEAYGNVESERIQEVPKEFVPDTVKVGETLTANTEQGPINVVVTEVRDDVVVLDGNHPMAGKVLNFDLELVEIV